MLAWATDAWTFCRYFFVEFSKTSLNFFSSWNCCPSGQSYQGTTISGLESNGDYYGQLSVDGNICTILSEANDETSSLSVARNGRVFDWVDATLETYYVEVRLVHWFF